MKGYITVSRLNKTGNYKSLLDFDNAFVSKENPNGYFKMVIQPIENEIKYMKVKNGYIVSGEAYVITDGNEKVIDKRIKQNYSKKWSNLIQTEVQTEDDLW